jgi:hypothetical protein
MLTELSPEQQELIPVVRDEWISRVYFNSDPLSLDESEATKFIEWVYSLAKFSAPIVMFADSPLHAQKIVNELYEKEGKTPSSSYHEPSSTVGVINYSWVAFYDYFTRIGVIDNEKFNQYKKWSELNIYDTIMLQDVCVVTRMPKTIKSTIYRDVRVPHSANGAAIEFVDGYSVYFWNGTIVAKHWIDDPSSITKEEILSTENAEERRILMEILGAKTYYDIITDGNGLTLIDEDTDNQGNPMRLYETTQHDSIVQSKVQFLEVTDPSTGRVYNIYPPNQNARNVWDAKAQTFSGEKLYARHGDVGIVREGYDGPTIIET